MFQTRKRLQGARLFAALLVLTAAGAALYFTWGIAWPLVAYLGVTTTVVLSVRLGWALAAGLVVTSGAFLLNVLLRVYPAFGWGLAAANGVILVVMAVCVSWLAAAQRNREARPSAQFVRITVASLVTPAIAASLIAFDLIRYGVARVSWAMNNDAVWNTMTARFMVDDGGLSPALHPNSSPLTAMVLASAIAPGRAGSPGSSLAHDVLNEAGACLALTVLASAFAALIVARSTAHRRPLVQIVCGLIGGFIPFTWYVAGFSFEYGFYNAPLALVLLLAAWIMWTDGARSPYATTIGLLIGTTALLATWAPLALVPLALAVLNVLRSRAVLVETRSAVRVLALVLAAAQVVAYVGLVTLADVKRDGSALGADGAIFPLGWKASVAVAVLSFVVVAVGYVGTRRRRDVAGLVVVIASAAAGVGYLVLQRGADSASWGYYPAKMAWFATILLLVIATSAAVRWAGVHRAHPWLAATSGIGAFGILVVLAVQVPPSVSTNSALRVAEEFVLGQGPNLRDADATALFSLASSGRNTVVSRFSRDPGGDSFINSWLLQLGATTSTDPVRAFAYSLDSHSSSQLCQLFITWDSPVRVVTRDPALEDNLTATCPDEPYTVILHE